jgi:hypothetical protein
MSLNTTTAEEMIRQGPEPTGPNGTPASKPPAPANDTAPLKAPPTPANDTAPLHTRMQSTLAPTSEFVRYFLLVYPSRYLFRGLFGLGFISDKPTTTGMLGTINRWLEKPGNWIHRHTNENIPRKEKYALSYNAALGVGSMALTLSYAKMVYADIKNIYAETVAEETGKPVEQINYKDIERSDNKIVQETISNFRGRTFSRLFTDLLFFPAALLRRQELGDLMIGVKGIQLFADTWKRKPSMFEDLVTFVNNKINPRNGLGQPISVGEVFDLFQHYADKHQPEKMFRTVLSQQTTEEQRHAISQPVFTRITELMNLTYAYKHGNHSDEAVAQANFALPKFIYMLGHDLIDPTHPVETMALVEVMNARGAKGVKQAQSMLAQGMKPEAVLEQFHLALPSKPENDPAAQGTNAVLAKGSTRQLDEAPVSKISLDAIAHEPPSRAAELGA